MRNFNDISTNLYAEINKNKGLEATGAIPFIPTYFLYKGLVNMFNKLAFKDKPAYLAGKDLINYNLIKAKELRTFTIIGAPVLYIGSIYLIKGITQPINIIIDFISLDNQIIKDGSLFSGLMFLSNKRLPNWLKGIIQIIFGLILLDFVYKYFGINNNSSFILFGSILFTKWFFILGSISSFIMICYYILSMYLYIMFSKNKFTMPIYLPQFILDWLKFIREISKSEKKGIFIEFYFRLILVYTFILFVTLYILFYLSNAI